MAANQNGWDEITPAELKPAIIGIKNKFEKTRWNCFETTEKLCCALLYPEVATNPKLTAKSLLLSHYMKSIDGIKKQEFLRHIGAETPPAIVKGFLDISRAMVALDLQFYYEEVLRIAIANHGLLTIGPAQWTRTIMRALVSTVKTDLELWIRQVCRDPNLSSGDLDRLLRVRLPMLVHMYPIGNTPYDRANAWTLESEDRSQDLLSRLAESFVKSLGFALDGIVESAEISIAQGGLQKHSKVAHSRIENASKPILQGEHEENDLAKPRGSTHPKPPTRRNSKSKSQACAETVAKINEELHKILPNIEAGQEDLEKLRKANPKFLTFKAIRRLPQLEEKILLLPSRRGRLLGLAQQLAGVIHKRKPETVKTDWKHFKPSSYRQFS